MYYFFYLNQHGTVDSYQNIDKVVVLEKYGELLADPKCSNFSGIYFSETLGGED